MRGIKIFPILDNYDRNKRIRYKRKTIKYVIIGEVLYKRLFNGALLICLTQHETTTTLE